jgi:hypothetical protein
MGTPTRLWRRVARGAAIALASLVVLVVIALFVAQSPPADRWLRDTLVEKLGERMRGEVSLEGLDWGLADGVTLTGLRITDAAGRPAVVLDRIEIRPMWVSLLAGQLCVTGLWLRGGSLAVHVDDAGELNLANLSREPIELPSRGLAVESIDVSGLVVRVEREGAAGLEVRDLSLWARLDLLGGDEGGRGQLYELSGRMRGQPPSPVGPQPEPAWMPLALSALDVTVDAQSASAQLAWAHVGPLVAWDASAARRSGPGAPVVRLRLPGVVVDRAALGSLLGRPFGAGAVTLSAALEGPENALDLDARLDAGQAALAVRGQVDATGGSVPTWALALDLAPLDLRDLVGPDAPAAVLGLALLAAGEGVEPSSARGDLAALVAPLELSAPLGLGALGSLSLAAAWTPARVTLASVATQLRGQTIRAEGSLERESRELTAAVRTEGPLPLGLLAESQAAEPTSVASRLRVRDGGLSAQVRVNGRLGGGWSDWAGELEAHVGAEGVALAEADGHSESGGGAQPLADRVALEVTLTKRRAGPVSGTVGLDLHGVERGRARVDRLQLEIAAQQAADSADRALLVDEVVATVETLRGSLGGVPVGLSSPARLVLTVDDEAMHAALDTSRWEVGAGRLTLAASARGAHHDFAATPELGDLSVDLDLSGLPTQTVARLARAGPAPVTGPLSGTLSLRGFPEDPVAHLRLGARLRFVGAPSAAAPSVDWALEGNLASQRLSIRSSATPRPQRDTGDGGRSGAGREPKPTLVATASVGLVVGEDLRPRLRAPLQVDARLDETPLAELLALAPGMGVPRELTAGERVSAVLRLRGAPRAPTGELLVSVDGGGDVAPGTTASWSLRGLLGLGARASTVDLALATESVPRMRLAGDVGVGTRELLGGRVEALTRAPLDLTLTLPDQPVPTFAADASTGRTDELLRAVGPLGRLSGSATLRGSVADPTLTGRVAFDRLLAGCGSRGKASLRVDADRDAGRVELAVLDATSDGAVGDERLRVALGADWSSMFAGGTASDAQARYGPLRWSVHTPAGGPIEVACVVPAALTRSLQLGVSGRLSSDLAGQAVVARDGALWSLAELDGQGALRFVEGRLALGDSGRVLHDVALELSIARGQVRLDRLEAHERDLQRPDRWLRASGQVAAAGDGYGQGTFEVRASKMLVMGPLDAPQAELDLTLDGTVDLRDDVNRVSMRVDQLELYAPIRLLRFLWPVTVGTGDLVEQQSADGRPPFSLPEPPERPDTEPPPVARATASPRTQRGAASAAEAVEPPPTGAERGWDVDVSFPKAFRIMQQGMTFDAHGRVHAELRPGGIEATSELVIDRGQLELLNHQLDLAHGSIAFLDGGRPWLDMTFRRLAPKTAQRQLAADGSALGHVVVRIGSSPGMDRLPLISGVPGPYMLDLMAVLHVDDVPRRSGPDLAASQSPQLPTEIQPLILSQMSLGFPDLLFLDHVLAWSDPLDDFDRYGEVHHLTGARYLSGGRGRVGLFGRPETAGLNRRGIHADWLWAHTARHTSGLGVRVGSELRAGVSLFYEWASEN